MHVIFQTNTVRMWLDREEENRVIILLFSCYMRKLREWFALLFALLVVPILAHTCWVCTFSCLCRERSVHYMIVLIPTVFLPYLYHSEKFEFTLHAHSWSFANIIVLCWLGSIHAVFVILLLSRKNWAQMKDLHDLSLPQEELARISNFLHSSTFDGKFGTLRIGHYANEFQLWGEGVNQKFQCPP